MPYNYTKSFVVISWLSWKLWPKMLMTNQILKKELMYEVDNIWHVDRHPKRHQTGWIFLVSVFRHTWECLKYFKILIPQYLKKELMYDVDFCMWVDIYGGTKFVTLFLVSVVKMLLWGIGEKASVEMVEVDLQCHQLYCI